MMTSEEIVKALRQCESGKPCAQCPVVNNKNCVGVMNKDAADLIERLEKEKAALIDIAIQEKLCDICKHNSWFTDHGYNWKFCDECGNYPKCPCADCLLSPKWELKA